MSLGDSQQRYLKGTNLTAILLKQLTLFDKMSPDRRLPLQAITMDWIGSSLHDTLSGYIGVCCNDVQEALAIVVLLSFVDVIYKNNNLAIIQQRKREKGICKMFVKLIIYFYFTLFADLLSTNKRKQKNSNLLKMCYFICYYRFNLLLMDLKNCDADFKRQWKREKNDFVKNVLDLLLFRFIG